ncbi:MAG TPA: UDP-2,3-diacylglucosamine diphosphatase LpxI [Lacipirellulaceae bacterium]|nr:UDP-2,3-diacylglucosamine diphosphatase LpxI [Lacipirellulaceae bacterium]
MPLGFQPQRIGLLAAWGRFPVLVAEALRRQDYHVSCLAVADLADPRLREICQDFHWVGWGKLGGALKFFRRCGIREATMAGKFHKVLLYQPGMWWRHLPDRKFIKTFYHYFITHARDNKDDTLLGALADAFAEEGIVFHPATDFAPELLVKPGQIAGKPPSAAQQKDIEFGWDVAKQMGGLDIGQSVCVKDRAVLAVEAIEGTDACILRAGELCKKGGFTVVKVAKPQQDMRFDVPTVGVRTLRTMVAAGARVLAVEGGRTILLDDDEFREFAAYHRLSVIALADGRAAEAAA